jgi:glycosyltransferase involved in cell wall biosynthesis
MNNNKPTVSVIVSTYNSPDMLRLVLLALAEQDLAEFEVIVVDDGSGDETKKTIEDIRPKINYDIRHVWQQHDGFRAAMIRNKGVAIARGEYLIFLDGDSIPRTSFIRSHKKLAENNYFVAGNRILLSSGFTEKVLMQQLPLQKWRIWNWLYAFYRGWTNRFIPMISLGNLYRRYWRGKKWQGAKTCNLGVWKKDFFAINGFDESYHGWGYEDSDFVVRLIRQGVLRKDGRFAIPVIHLWHPSSDRSNERDNYKKLEEIIHSSCIRAKSGVDQYIDGMRTAII